MEHLSKLDFTPLNVSGENYVSWTMDVKIHLTSKKLRMAIVKENLLNEAQKAEAMILIRRHLDEVLRLEYSSIEDPQILVDALAICRIKSTLEFCGEKLTDAEILEKTYSTFPASHMILSQQYRAKNYTQFSELVTVLLLAEKNLDLLLKNNQARPVGTRPLPEANLVNRNPQPLPEANLVYINNRGGGRGRGFNRRVRGRGNRDGHVPYNRPPNGPPQYGQRGNMPRGGNNARPRGAQQNRVPNQNQNQNRDTCHRCGGTGHWSRTCRARNVMVGGVNNNAPPETNLVEIDVLNEEPIARLPNLGTSDPMTQFGI
ncbi:PREDICTED: uncharacterized protein LOC105950961 [Erythranthe guttata]|uniref:uncharacterized protein LOC105950961 n=1 Tax=Erythranthe guttata TaxID=4155 RepID=UPI00064DBC1C|nr:PREDICTED: uncharacterized protein LOC105950961 [Erythranthe guttata]|eukprot:XP_012829803.1 PREDICTED: uncharacterized protein LOC105950961 [Erythranthe guttata]